MVHPVVVCCAAFLGVAGVAIYEKIKEDTRMKRKKDGLYEPRADMQDLATLSRKELRQRYKHAAQMMEVGSGGYNNPFQAWRRVVSRFPLHYTHTKIYLNATYLFVYICYHS